MIFVDTGAWYASLVPADPDHAKAAFLGSNQFHVLSTAYRARNLAHHEQIGLPVKPCFQLLNAVGWRLQFPTLSGANGSDADMPVNQDELFHLIA